MSYMFYSVFDNAIKGIRTHIAYLSALAYFVMKHACRPKRVPFRKHTKRCKGPQIEFLENETDDSGASEPDSDRESDDGDVEAGGSDSTESSHSTSVSDEAECGEDGGGNMCGSGLWRLNDVPRGCFSLVFVVLLASHLVLLQWFCSKFFRFVFGISMDTIVPNVFYTLSTHVHLYYICIDNK